MKNKSLLILLFLIIVLSYFSGGIINHYHFRFVAEKTPFGYISIKLILGLLLTPLLICIFLLVKKIISGYFDKENIFIGTHKTKLFAASIFLVTTIGTFTGFRNNQPTIFNVLNYGVLLDAKQVLDGVVNGTTTFTSATANFTSADVGKAIRLPRAGSSGHALVTTIASVSNSTTVILTNGATGSFSADTATYGTDNTVAFQSAITADSLAGGGKILWPTGWGLLAGPLLTNIGGQNPNCQIHWPVSQSNVAGSADNRMKFHITGESAPTELVYGNANFLTPHRGSVIESIIDGTPGSAIFGSKSSNSGNHNINNNEVTYQDLVILNAMNGENGGASNGGINDYYMAGTDITNCDVSVDGNIGEGTTNHAYMTNENAAVVLNEQGGEIMNHANNLFIAGYKYGLISADHATVTKASILWCTFGRVYAQQYDGCQDADLNLQWCQNLIYCPKNALLGGLITVGTSGSSNSYVKIGMLDAECYLTGVWYTTSVMVNDSNSLLKLSGFYSLSQSANGLSPGTQNILPNYIGSGGTSDSTVFLYNVGHALVGLSTTGGTGAATFSTNTNTLNIPTPTLTGVLNNGNTATSVQQIIMQNYSATQAAFKAGSFGIESRGFDNTMLQNNTHFDGTHWLYDSTGQAQSLQIQNSVWYFANTVSGTTGGVITWTFPEVIQSSNNITFTNSSNTVTDYATGLVQAQTTTEAQLSLLYNSSNHSEETVNSTGNLTIAPSGGTITLSGNVTLPVAKVLSITEGSNGRVGQTTLSSGTKAITITGLTTSSRAFLQLVSQGGTVTTTVNYEGVCTSNTLTINAVTNAGNTLNTLDGSTLNYFVIN